MKDWMTEAAIAIADNVEHEHLRDGISTILSIMKMYCPMLPNVAYMPVPRCETCGHWDERQRNDGKGHCDEPWVMAIVPKEFGCVNHKTVV